MHVLLDQAAPGLVARLEALPTDARRSAVAAGCLLVARQLGGLSPAARRLLEQLEQNRPLSEADAAAATRLAEAADARYFDLQDVDGGQDQALGHFSEARLLTALALLFGGAEPHSACEAAYELLEACDDPAVALRAIDAGLRDRSG